MSSDKKNYSRREFLKRMGLSAASASAMLALGDLSSLASVKPGKADSPDFLQDNGNRMSYRVNTHTGDKVSLLGYGMMRLPFKDGQIDQEMVNKEVDYAIAHGVNYFDTAPIYCGGRSETATGIALHRHPRKSYFIATKMSNQNPSLRSLDKCKEMYENSFKNLQVDYIDYYLLHSIGGSGMKEFNERFIDNGLLDFLLKERKAGRIRNLGFSYHGNVEVFDWLVNNNDKYHWDFCQIECNYIDWRHASLSKNGWKHDADAEYLYNKSEKAHIQNVVMEPLLGGRLARLPQQYYDQLKAVRPDDSAASWAFRWVSSKSNILVTLSGMTQMNVLEENVKTFSPLAALTPEEENLLEKISDGMSGMPVVPCTGCRYCMPCPFGVDIPGNFAYYNDVINKGNLPTKSAADYEAKSKAFIDGYKKTLKKENWSNACRDCEACLPKCPQQIRIPNQLSRITELLNTEA